MAKFFKVIMNILIILFIASFVALFVPPLLGITTVVSEPDVDSNLQTGTVAYGTKESLDSLSVGDTIIYNSEEKTYIYEIVDMSDSESGSLTVKAYEDSEPETISVRRTATKLLFYVPFIGYIFIAIGSTEGLIILGLIAALLIVLFVIAEIFCRKAKARKEGQLDEEEEYEQDRKYFRDLAASQRKPNSLDALGTLSIPPVADLMEEEISGSSNSNTIALDEEYENPELILKPADDETELSKTSPVALEITDEDDETEKDIEISSDSEQKHKIKKTDKTHKDTAKETASESSRQAINNTVSDKKADSNIIKTSDISNIGSALEIVLENERINPTPHSTPVAAPVQEHIQQAPVEEIELAIPAKTLDELLQEAYLNGEDPKVAKDSTTGITFVDYSNCF